MLVVMKDGEIDYITKNGSTLPSNPSKTDGNPAGNAVLMEGTYSLVGINHRGNYSAAQVQKNASGSRLPVYRHGTVYNNANGVNIHTAGTDTSVAWSTGCITVAMQDYADFGRHVGFLEQSSEVAYLENEKYSDFTRRIGTGNTQKGGLGQFVLDRSELRLSLARDRGTWRVSEKTYKDCMLYYFGVRV